MKITFHLIIALLALAFSNQLSASRVLTESIQKQLVPLWDDTTSSENNLNWYYNPRIGWFWLDPEWELYEPETGTVDEDLWIWNSTESDWEFWMVNWTTGYLAVYVPNGSLIWTETLGWLYTAKEYYPWCYRFSEGAWIYRADH